MDAKGNDENKYKKAKQSSNKSHFLISLQGSGRVAVC